MIMRPASIDTFERVVLLIVILSAASAVIAWDETAAQLAPQGIGEGALFGGLAALLGLTLLLGWLASRRRSNVARWLYVLLIVLMLALAAPSLPRLVDGSAVHLVLNAAYVLLCALSLLLLFRSDARRWFSRDGA
jgi:hypothetical protein